MTPIIRSLHYCISKPKTKIYKIWRPLACLSLFVFFFFSSCEKEHVITAARMMFRRRIHKWSQSIRMSACLLYSNYMIGSILWCITVGDVLQQWHYTQIIERYQFSSFQNMKDLKLYYIWEYIIMIDQIILSIAALS